MQKIVRLLVLLLMLAGSTAASAQTSGVKIVTGHPDFKIKITRCEASGTTCILDLLLQNIGANDTNVKVFGGDYNATVLYDDEGNAYSGRQVRVSVGNKTPSSWMNACTLPSEVPVRARLQIEGVPESATLFTRIDLRLECPQWGFEWGQNPPKKAKIINVPIFREGDF